MNSKGCSKFITSGQATTRALCACRPLSAADTDLDLWIWYQMRPWTVEFKPSEHDKHVSAVCHGYLKNKCCPCPLIGQQFHQFISSKPVTKRSLIRLLNLTFVCLCGSLCSQSATVRKFSLFKCASLFSLFYVFFFLVLPAKYKNALSTQRIF